MLWRDLVAGSACAAAASAAGQVPPCVPIRHEHHSTHAGADCQGT